MDLPYRPDDKVVKGFGIPALGLLIPFFSGLVRPGGHAWPALIACCLYFIALVFILWQGCFYLQQNIRKRSGLTNHSYYKTIIILLLVNIAFSCSMSFALLRLWQLVGHNLPPGDGSINHAMLMLVAATCFITIFYEICFLQQERVRQEARLQQLTIEKCQAELESLKSQISPHFIFNALNTLSFLISRDPASARRYSDTLAHVYRYLLGNKQRDLVLLIEEIDFIRHYFHLLKIRYEEAIDMVIDIPESSAERILIPPISLQTLIENAIKHNNFTPRYPLSITVYLASDYIVVHNPLLQKSNPTPGTQLGLINLDSRYRLLTKRTIIIEQQQNSFIVKLPIIIF